MKPTNFRPARSAMVSPSNMSLGHYDRHKVQNALAGKSFRRRRDAWSGAPPRHECGGEKGKHQIAALVEGRVAGLDDAPFGERSRGRYRSDPAAEPARVA